MGVFGGYTRWAVVFLIIFVLFFLLTPDYVAAPCGPVAAEYPTTMSYPVHHHVSMYQSQMYGGAHQSQMMGAGTGSHYGGSHYGSSPSSL